jgi:CHAT domain-containing protein
MLPGACKPARICVSLALLLAASTAAALAQQDAARPLLVRRTIADITAILDQEKPDPETVSRLRVAANADPNPGMKAGDLAIFYYRRCEARSDLGEVQNALADCAKAVEQGQGSLSAADIGRIQHALATQYKFAGDQQMALQVYKRILRPNERSGYDFSVNLNVAQIYLRVGDLAQAETYVRRNDELLAAARKWKGYATAFRRASWHSSVENGHALLFEARGQFREAEAAYKRTEDFKREMLASNEFLDGLRPREDQIQQALDSAIIKQGRVKASQGRMAEAEADMRRALLSRLKAAGKYNVRTATYIGHLAGLLIEQGRLAEAEQLLRTQIEINEALGIAKNSRNTAETLGRLASTLGLQDRWLEAEEVYAQLDEATANWPTENKSETNLNSDRIAALYFTDKVTAGIAIAERLLERQQARYGDRSSVASYARGLLAVGLALAGRDTAAKQQFELAMPILATSSLETDLDDTTGSARDQRLGLIMEGYFGVRARSGTPEDAIESFRLSDVARGHSVEKALAASNARLLAADSSLAELARVAQDLDKQITALLGTLNNALAQPSDQRDAAALKVLQGDIDELRAQRASAKQDLANGFPKYASLVEPRSPNVDEIRQILREDEAFVTFYFGRTSGYVWVVPKTGPVAFAALPLGAPDLAAKVKHLRVAVEPEGDYLSDIQPFDVAGGYELFAQLLKPVERAWRPAKSLIVSTNGALGLLPLSLLPTEPDPVTPGTPLFAGYRNVAWLARSHAVTIVPSAASLRSLRELPADAGKRETMIGFGDPYFSKEQAAEAQKQGAILETSVASRGLRVRRRALVQTDGVDKAELARLPRLPDTADELTSMALALSADPAKVLHLGKDANEKTVKDIDLSKFRIIAFATHGLVPGDLEGLTEPALALTAPDVADVDGDGLLTMEEVLALKLNADWVVLSACNTATGAGAGAEAVSGLGRAFFYAGARTLLVTNWAVHSASARDLVSDLFRQQGGDAKLARGEALRRAMLSVMDGPGFKDESGKAEYAYAHPIFWAPYSIIGDGGSARP